MKKVITISHEGYDGTKGVASLFADKIKPLNALALITAHRASVCHHYKRADKRHFDATNTCLSHTPAWWQKSGMWLRSVDFLTSAVISCGALP